MNQTMSRKLSAALGTGVLCLFSTAGMAQNVPDVTQVDRLSHLSVDDLDLIQDAVSEALNDPRNQTTVRWRNEANGNAGRAQVVSTFRARDARSCKLVRIVAPDVDGNLSYTVCRDEAGNWLEASDVRAPRQRG